MSAAELFGTGIPHARIGAVILFVEPAQPFTSVRELEESLMRTVAVPLILMAIAHRARYFPASRASRIDSITMLHYE